MRTDTHMVQWLGGILDGCTKKYEEPIPEWWYGPDPHDKDNPVTMRLLWYRLERRPDQLYAYVFCPEGPPA